MSTTSITSRCTVKAGSLGRLPTKEGTTINYGAIKREPVMGDDGVLGYQEIIVSAPFIKTTITHAKTTDEDAIKNFVDEDVSLTTNNGKAYTLKNAWMGEMGELNVKDGSLEVTFYGTELLPH
ncbi:phage tail tube protein [Vibrio scophthalmi]|uniref:Phage tail tube protein n=1 Tax=Vibrio scophthalmi TaxID=45658 RepID=A0A1E3WIZ0_9VIBR|nr:phage tail tube protein [Vibrio scophthalmi]ODS09733.1 hypothetical protein VSF3289_03195 [Vibrio scophthalmi]